MATVAAPPPPESPSLKRVAPWLHTFLVVGLMMMLSFYGSGGRQQRQVLRYGRIPSYLSLIGVEWLVVGLVWVSIRRERVTLSELVGGKWDRFESVLLDVAVAAGFWVASAVVLFAAGLALGLRRQALDDVRRTIGFLAPHSGWQLLVWLFVCLTAGFCEEVIFRGLFQRQFAALTRSPWGGLVIQALLFGAAHGYQGIRHMAQIAVYGALFGGLALWRKNLRPGMMAHAWQDTLSGFLFFVLARIKGW